MTEVNQLQRPALVQGVPFCQSGMKIIFRLPFLTTDLFFRDVSFKIQGSEIANTQNIQI